MEIIELNNWGIKNDGNILNIVGPCSAETEEQVINTAKQLIHKNIHVFRAGIWKPRTRPGVFEGVGESGLNWLNRVQNKFGMKVAIEVATKEHVRLALKYNIDILWIGVRTTVSPFAVQEIADALKKYKSIDKPILVKNPINPDINLWIGAIERLSKIGIKKIGAIHRGFSTFEQIEFRNAPKWQIPIELKRRLPHIPIICDPSHIAGKRDLIFDISQTALDLAFDGLMIEAHENPDKAWSDASQQIYPKHAIEIIEKLQFQNKETKSLDEMKEINNFRKQITEIDHRLIAIMAQRMEIAHEIGKIKKKSNITILQNKHWSDVFKDRKDIALKEGLSEEFIIKILEAIHQESINKQR